MKFLRKGQYFGIRKKISQFAGITITETDYPNPISVPWHYHENAHFTFFLKGHVLETSKKDSFYCTPGSLIFSNSQEPHRDTRHSPGMHYFHVEIESDWFLKHQFKSSIYEGHTFFDKPPFREFFHRIYKEFRINDSASHMSIDGLLLQAFGEMKRFKEKPTGETPEWVRRLKAYMHNNCSKAISLSDLSRECGRSTVYLSQIFPKYLHLTFGEYLRSIRIEKATSMLSGKNISLSQVALETGFSDQSHFNRCFKRIHGITPGEYVKKFS